MLGFPSCIRGCRSFGLEQEALQNKWGVVKSWLQQLKDLHAISRKFLWILGSEQAGACHLRDAWAPVFCEPENYVANHGSFKNTTQAASISCDVS